MNAHSIVFRDNDKRVYQITIDHVFNLWRTVEFNEITTDYFDHIEHKGHIKCFTCDKRIGPGYLMLAIMVIVNDLNDDDNSDIFGVCSRCEDRPQIAEKIVKSFRTVPGSHVHDVHPNVGFA